MIPGMNDFYRMKAGHGHQVIIDIRAKALNRIADKDCDRPDVALDHGPDNGINDPDIDGIGRNYQFINYSNLFNDEWNESKGIEAIDGPKKVYIIFPRNPSGKLLYVLNFLTMDVKEILKVAITGCRQFVFC